MNVDWTRVDSARATPGLVDSLRDGSLRVDSARAAPVGVDSAAVAPPVDSATIAQARVDSVAASPARDPLWPVAGPEPLPGALLPHKRIVAYYGNPLSRRMGILGEVPPDSMLKRLDAEVAAWEAADPATPVQPALHLVTIVAQADAGPSGKYRALMSDSVIERVASWAERRGAIVFLDLQIGLSTLQDELPRIAKFLERPNFNLGIDPEFMMKDGSPPGKRIGHITAEDVNYAVRFLGEIVERHDLPPKVLVIHRFTDGMVRNSEDIELDPRVQIVIHMDGWGPPRLKRASYREYVYEQPVQFAGFKVFYRNDTRQGHPVMTPEEILKLFPRPLYIQYQ